MTDGMGLARGYYRDVVAPLLRRRWPRLAHAAGRLGGGSDVLGLDDETSRDHDWGLRLTLLVEGGLDGEVACYLAEHLPDRYAGHPTRFATTADPLVRHRVELSTTEAFVRAHLGLDVDATRALTSLDWLCVTGQSVLEVTAGDVFADGPGLITAVRQHLAWYPDDVWFHVIAADWARLAEDIPLMGRTGQCGDEVGSRVLAARVASTAMHLALLLARRWPPYPKWQGSLLARLPGAPDLVPALTAVLAAPDPPQRQQTVARAAGLLYRAQRAAGLPVVGDRATEPFFDRPYLGVRAGITDALRSAVCDPVLRALPPGVGSVEQWADGVTLLTDPARRVEVTRCYLAAAIARP